MKIGIITFHWATNYGAVLQAYALQYYLYKLGHEVSIINYRPKRHKKTFFKCFFTKRPWIIPKRISEYFKENTIERFRRTYLNETRIYETENEIKKEPPKFDIYICGSDQIWNPSFTLGGEGKPTGVYFLDFGESNITRIAYAVSFGCVKYPDVAGKLMKKYISSFKSISVREQTGTEILSGFGLKNALTLPDPTLLLDQTDYLFTKNECRSGEMAFVYILRNENTIACQIQKLIEKKYIFINPNKIFREYTIEQWINYIQRTKLVITNSYHGVLFSLIYHVPFLVILSHGVSAGMNDRFYTILTPIGLEHRAIQKFEVRQITELLNEDIDWTIVDKHVEGLKHKANLFFQSHLEQ